MNSSKNARTAQPGAGRAYTVDELLKAIEPQYQMYKLTMRQCIAGLSAHAEDDTPKGYREMAEQIGSAFDHAVSAARDSGQAPMSGDQARQDILDGLELYAQEMVACGDMAPWVKECEDLSEQLKVEWQTGVPPDQVCGEKTNMGMGGMEL